MKLKGYGLLQPGDRQRVLTNSEMSHRSLSFMVLRDRWKYLEPTKGNYDFSRLIEQIQRCIKFNKKFTISIMTGGDCNPDYLVKKQPWNLDNIERYGLLHSKLHEEIGKLFNYPLSSVAGVWITGPTVPSQEMHLKTSGGVDAEKFPGYSEDKMVEAWKLASNLVYDKWAFTTGILSISGQNAVYKTYLDNIIVHNIALWSENNIAFQHNSLGKQTSLGSNHHKKLLELHKKGYCVGAEMVQPGHAAAISKFPEADYIVLYPGDQTAKLPSRPK